MLYPLRKFVVLASLLAVCSMTLLNMWKDKGAFASFVLLSAATGKSTAQCDLGSQTVDLKWHPPNATAINNLTVVINATGVNGFQFEATTPSTIPYSTYNWCVMPHVRPQEYVVPPSDFKLKYVEVVGRSFPCRRRD